MKTTLDLPDDLMREVKLRAVIQGRTLAGCVASAGAGELARRAAGTFALWRTFATRDTASPKVWMDAYLAAFSVAGKLALGHTGSRLQKFCAPGA